ncbi:hypothetical protein KW786_02725 [Candidatus Parcubacteria bacterium]|nr:hypothetical protein [Candidatus Parcubacteria bacterium]
MKRLWRVVIEEQILEMMGMVFLAVFLIIGAGACLGTWWAGSPPFKWMGNPWDWGKALVLPVFFSICVGVILLLLSLGERK